MAKKKSKKAQRIQKSEQLERSRREAQFATAGTLPAPVAMGLCATLRRSIADLKSRIRKGWQRVNRINALIDELYGEPTTDPATILQLQLEVWRITEQIKDDQDSLAQVELDYTYAGCGSQDGPGGGGPHH
ncbi:MULTISPECIES: hypothetical protein [Streptomyces]|uniref:Uncharacterized protein n=2 Tax=Streptomyces TaxID=1883 RepID=A0ABU4K1N9_9ACTN|nr:hypothetical protein [Streptomyces roseolus]MDX2291666.1 hypothetical protein [Streptomyces roseolus]